MINKILSLNKFSRFSELKELIKEKEELISYLIFFENVSGILKINLIETKMEGFSIVNFPIISKLNINNILKKTNGWCVSLDKDARDILLIHSFKLFCPFTGIANVNIGKIIFKKLEFYLQEVQNEMSFKNSSAEIIYLQMALVIKYISRNIENNNSTSLIADEKTKEFSDLVNKEYKNNHNLGFYTNEMCMSAKTLSRLTKQKLNISPKQIIQYRINAEAIRLLIHSNLSIKEIAYDLNFTSPDYFNYFFKKFNKLSPSAYKNKMSENLSFLS